MSTYPSVKKLLSSRIRDSDWTGTPWEEAETQMRAGHLPCYSTCQQLADPKNLPKEFTRRHQWVVAGALETLRVVSEEAGNLYHEIKGLRANSMAAKRTSDQKQRKGETDGTRR